MYLFSRRVQLANGDLRGALSWAVEQTRLVNDLLDLEVRLHSQILSPGVGTLVWTTFVESLDQLEAADDTLMASDDHVAATDRGARFVTGPADDAVMALLHGLPRRDVELTHAWSVQALLASGHAAPGIEMGIEISQTAERLTGIPTMFGTALTGTYGAVGWVTAYSSLAEMEAANSRLNSDADWLELIDTKAAGAFAEEPAFSRQQFYRRIA
jgi:hypothetical protein